MPCCGWKRSRRSQPEITPWCSCAGSEPLLLGNLMPGKQWHGLAELVAVWQQTPLEILHPKTGRQFPAELLAHLLAGLRHDGIEQHAYMRERLCEMAQDAVESGALRFILCELEGLCGIHKLVGMRDDL